jgi:hypothetical protein
MAQAVPVMDNIVVLLERGFAFDYAEMQWLMLRGKAGRLRDCSDWRAIFRAASLSRKQAVLGIELSWEGYYCRNLDTAALAVKGLSLIFHSQNID